MGVGVLRILLVDDDEDDRLVTRDMLAESGRAWYELTAVASYEDALTAIKAGQHDVYLIDYRLGEHDGLGLLREVRAQGDRKPIVLLTGAGDYDVDVEAMKAGAADYLVKGQISPALLERSIRYAVERARTVDALRESEQRFRLMADTAPVFIWIADRDGRCTFVNKRWLEFTGRQLEQELGDGWLESVHPDDLDKCVQAHRKAFEVRAEFQIVCRLRRHDGQYRWVLNTGVPRSVDGQDFAGHIGSCIDITDRKLAEDELAEARNYARNLIDSSLDIIVAVDMNRQIVEFNRAAEVTFGYQADEVLGQHVDVLYEDSSDGVRIHQAVRDGGTFAGEVTNRRKDGSTFPVLLSASVLPDAKGQPLGVMGVSRDITELRAARSELEATLALVNKSREDMLAILNQLRLGIVMTDDHGGVTFLSQACQQLLECSDDSIGVHWEKLCPFEERDKDKLKAMLLRSPPEREKIPVHMEAPGGRHYWMEVEVHDDPREPQRKIFLLYDMTEVRDLRRLLDEKARYEDLVGRSEPMQQVYQLIGDLAKVDSTVLIEGATGTGKELVARAIHFSSHRKDKPFIPVNCAGLTESLLGSQLFGHKRGAFTGAIEDQLGVFETAAGGTVFLDEIGDISSNVQTSLLRVLQEKEITRLGEARARKIDIRIIAATHQDLNRAIEEGRFRTDLLYRIRVARIYLPLLRERRVDIPLLTEAFLNKSRATTGKPVERVSDEAMGLLLNHGWPGNVRELQSAIEFAVIRCKGAVIQPDDLPPEVVGSLPVRQPSVDPQEEDRQKLLAAVQAARGNRAEAARLLGVSRSTLYRRLADLELDPEKLA